MPRIRACSDFGRRGSPCCAWGFEGWVAPPTGRKFHREVVQAILDMGRQQSECRPLLPSLARRSSDGAPRGAPAYRYQLAAEHCQPASGPCMQLPPPPPPPPLPPLPPARAHRLPNPPHQPTRPTGLKKKQREAGQDAMEADDGGGWQTGPPAEDGAAGDFIGGRAGCRGCSNQPPSVMLSAQFLLTAVAAGHCCRGESLACSSRRRCADQHNHQCLNCCSVQPFS